MKKAEFIERLAQKMRMNKGQSEAFVEAFEETVIEALQAGDDVTLTGFGTFMAKKRSARMGVNPQNPSERIKIPEVTVPKFKAGKTLKDSLKKEAAPKPEAPAEPEPEAEAEAPAEETPQE